MEQVTTWNNEYREMKNRVYDRKDNNVVTVDTDRLHATIVFYLPTQNMSTLDGQRVF